MQAILNAHLHLDGGVELGVGAQSVHDDVHLLHHIVQPAADGRAEEIAARREVLLGLHRQQQGPSREGQGRHWAGQAVLLQQVATAESLTQDCEWVLKGLEHLS